MGAQKDTPVREPSSMIRQVRWPSLRISPDLAGTKLMGRRGMAMVERACRASSSMVRAVVGEGLGGQDWRCWWGVGSAMNHGLRDEVVFTY